MKTLYLLSIPFLLLAAQCIPEKPEPPEPQLPPITTTGEGTFGCKINGVVWLPKGKFPNVSAITADWNSGNAQVKAQNASGNEQDGTIHFHTINASDIGIYKIATDTTEAYVHNHYLNCYYDWNEVHSGEIVISYLDTIKRIISGTFWFKASTSGCEDIEVTDGRFDINY